MKFLGVLLTVVGVLTSSVSFSVCDDAHETTCPVNCQCDCSGQTAIHTHDAPSIKTPVCEQSVTGADTQRVDRLLTDDIFRPPISA